MEAITAHAGADGSRRPAMNDKNKGGRPRVGDDTLPPITIPSRVKQIAIEMAEYEGVSLAEFIRRAVVVHIKNQTTAEKHA